MNKESRVLDVIAELEAEEAAQPRRPWWTSYEEAAERGAVIDVSPPSPHVHRVSPDDSDVPLEQREGIRRLQFANERVRRLREGRLRDVVITNDTGRAREYCRRNGIPAHGLAAPYMANRLDKLRSLDLMNCRLHEVFSPGNSAMREWDPLSAMLRAYAGYAGYPLGWFYGRIEH